MRRTAVHEGEVRTDSLRIPKKPDMGSLAEVKGRANIRAPAEMIRRCTGQSLSISTPFPYLVPRTKVEDGEREASMVGTYSGGCCTKEIRDGLTNLEESRTCRSASIHSILSPIPSWNPRTTALLRPRSVVLTTMRTLYPSCCNDWTFSTDPSRELSSTMMTSTCSAGTGESALRSAANIRVTNGRIFPFSLKAGTMTE